MNDLQKRFAAFFLGCIPVRISFVIAARKLNKEQLKTMGFLALLPAIGFLYYYFRWASEKGLAMFNEVWWNHMRPIHALLYFFFAYQAITGNRNLAWKTLAFDVAIGAISFLLHYKSP